MLNTLKLLVRDEEGATMIEYVGPSAGSLFNTAAGSV
jgi:hypothetical protein